MLSLFHLAESQKCHRFALSKSRSFLLEDKNVCSFPLISLVRYTVVVLLFHQFDINGDSKNNNTIL